PARVPEPGGDGPPAAVTSQETRMFSSALKEVKGGLDRRSLMNYFFPSLLFWGLSAAVWLLARGDLAQVVADWEGQTTGAKVLQIAAALAGVMVFAAVLASQMLPLLRLYEG